MRNWHDIGRGRRDLGPIAHPTPGQILRATCGERTWLELNECVHRVHLGEDGPDVTLVIEREFTIERQQHSGDFLPWMYDEYLDSIGA